MSDEPTTSSKPRDLSMTPADIKALFARNPLAAQQIQTIIMERLLNEAEVREAAQSPDKDVE